MPLPYKTPEQKKKFLESYKDVYKALGMTDEQINNYIKKRLETETEEERLYEQSSAIIDKYDAISKNNVKYTTFIYKRAGEIGRIVRAMGRPETSAENIEYNNLLARKLQSRDGIVEILQEAITMLATADKKIYLETEKDINKIYDQYNIRNLALADDNLYNMIAPYKKALNITEEELPTEVSDAFVKNKGVYQLAINEDSQLRANCEEFNLALPTLDELSPIDLNAEPEVIKEQRAAREKLTENAIFNVTELKERSFEFKNAFSKYMAKKATQDLKNKDKDVVFEKESEVEKAFYKKITDRMAEEKNDYVAAVNKAKAKVTNEFLVEDNGLYSTLKGDQTILSSKDAAKVKAYKDIIAENQTLSDERLKIVKPKILETYNKPIKDMIEDMYNDVKDNSIVGHHNENYKDMLESLKELREMVKTGQLDDDHKRAFKLAMEKLGGAAGRYLENKHCDEKRYSTRALNRIGAATLCAGIYRGFKSQFILEDNLEAEKEFNPAAGMKDKLLANDLTKMYSEASAKYCKNPTVENFAVIWSIDYADTQINKNGLVLYGDDLYTMIEANKKMYSKLAEMDGKFKEAMTQGVYDIARDNFKKVTKDIQTNHNVDEELKRKNPENKDIKNLNAPNLK